MGWHFVHQFLVRKEASEYIIGSTLAQGPCHVLPKCLHPGWPIKLGAGFGYDNLVCHQLPQPLRLVSSQYCSVYLKVILIRGGNCYLATHLCKEWLPRKQWSGHEWSRHAAGGQSPGGLTVEPDTYRAWPASNLVERICKNKYMDFAELPPARGRSRDPAQVAEGYILVLQPGDLMPARWAILDLAAKLD